MSELTPQEASEAAVHKAKSAQAAVELSREVHLEELVEKTADRTKQALMESLKEVFGYSDKPADSKEMTILIRRIPLICQDVKQIHFDIAGIRNDIKWGTRLVIGAVILALVGMVIKTHL